MGLINALLTLILSIFLVKSIKKNKEKLQKYPLLKIILYYTENIDKSYLIIFFMTLIIIFQ